MNRKDLDESADISLTEDDTGLDRSMGIGEVTAEAEIETEPYRDPSEPRQASKAPGLLNQPNRDETKPIHKITSLPTNGTDTPVANTSSADDLADGSNTTQKAGESDSAFKKVKDQAADKPATLGAPHDPRQLKIPQKDQLQSIEEESGSNVSTSYQSIYLDQSAVHTDAKPPTEIKDETSNALGRNETAGDLTDHTDPPKDADDSHLDETQKGYRPELDFGISIDHRDQLESSLIAPTPGGYESILNPLNLSAGQPNELSHIVETLKSSQEMIDMDQELSSLPESKEVAEEFPPLRHLLEHQEYSHSGQHFAIGDESVLLISQNKTQVHMHHIEGRHKPFVLFSNKGAKVSEVHLVKEILPKTSVALISFELDNRHFVSGKGVDEDNFAGFDCKFVYEVPSKPSLFRSNLNWAGFTFKRTKTYNEEPRIVLLDFKQEQFKLLLSPNALPQALVVPSVVDLSTENSLDSIGDLAISTKNGLSLAVAPLRDHDPSFGGRIIVFNPAGESREFSVARYQDPQAEGDGIVMVEFFQKKYATCSEECFLAIEDSEGYVFSIKNRTISGWKADLIQRFSIISGLTGPNSQPLQRSEVFLTHNNLIVFRSSAYWMLVFKLDEEVNSSGIGSVRIVGQARFRTNLTYCGYSIHQTSTKQAICVGKAFPEHKGNYLIQNLVGLSRNEIYKEPTSISLQEMRDSPKIETPEEKAESAAPVTAVKAEEIPKEPEVIQPTRPPETDLSQKMPIIAATVERPTAGLLELGLGSAMTGEQFFDQLSKGDPHFGVSGSAPEPQEELSRNGSKEPVDDGQAETKSVSASEMMKELIWGSNSQEPVKPVQNSEPGEPTEKATEGGRHVTQNTTSPSTSKKPQDASTSQGKHQNSKKPEEQKPVHKSKDNTQKSGNYNSKTSSGNGIYKPKTEAVAGSSQQTYVPVNQLKVTQPTAAKAPSGKHKPTPVDDKDTKDREFKGGKNRSKTPATKNFGPRGTSTSSEEKYEPKHPQQLSQASPGQQDGLQTFGAKLDQNNHVHSAQTNGSTSGQRVEVSTFSTPAFRATESADIAHLRRLALGEDSGLDEGAARTIERAMLRFWETLQNQQSGQTRATLPDNFENAIREVFERVCEEKLINSMKTKFECMLSNSFNEAFEELMIPIFEKYLSKVFDKTGQILEKGLRFYSDKISIEERKISQFKDQFSQMTTQFLTHSKAFNKLCQDMSQTKKDLETGQSKDLSKRMSLIEESVEKIKDKQDTMLEILLRLDQRSKQQEQDKKAEPTAVATPTPVSAPMVQTNPNVGPQLNIDGQSPASSLLQRPSDPNGQMSNQQLANLLLSSLSHPSGNQRPQQAPANVHTLLPGLPGGHNQMSGPHYSSFAPNQPYVQHQTLQANSVSLQALQQLLQQRSQQPSQPMTLGNSGMYSSQSNPSLDNSLNGSMILPGGGPAYQDTRQLHQSSQAVAEAEIIDRLVRLANPR